MRIDDIVYMQRVHAICCMVGLVRCGTSRVIRPRPTHLVKGGHWTLMRGHNGRKVPQSGHMKRYQKMHVRVAQHTWSGGPLDTQSHEGTQWKKICLFFNEGACCGTTHCNGKKPHISESSWGQINAHEMRAQWKMFPHKCILNISGNLRKHANEVTEKDGIEGRKTLIWGDAAWLYEA